VSDDPKPKDADAPSDDDLDTSGLGGWERFFAGLVGAVGVGAGGVGIFLSENQAGTTTILLVGAVFLLMSVQGTRIIKAGKDSVELEQKRRGRKLTERAVEAIENKKDPEKAAELAAAARRADPSLSKEPSFRYLKHQIYERQAYEAVRRAIDHLIEDGALPAEGSAPYLGSEVVAPSGTRYDGSLNRIGTRQIYVEFRNYRRALSVNTIRELRGQALEDGADVLLVTPTEPDAWVRSQGENFKSARVVPAKWADESDDVNIEKALLTLIG